MTDRIQSTTAMSAEIERLKASKAHILEDAKQAREAVRQLREDDKATIAHLRDRVAGLEEMLGRWVTWSCGQQGPSPFNETRVLLTQNEVG